MSRPSRNGTLRGVRERRRVAAAEVGELVRGLRPSKELREDVRSTVADIVDMVRDGGDEAVRRLTSRLDGVDIERSRVAPSLHARARSTTSTPTFAPPSSFWPRTSERSPTDKMPRPTQVTLRHGQVVSTRQVPVRRVGVYVPGGLAAYPSSAVMAIVPAQVAGVPEIAACSPPGPSGLPHSGALAVCALLGVEEVYAVGGAQAVAALALGTASIPAVDMVVGPGNAYVEEAKRRLFGEVGIESLAGPTELVIVADASAPADAAALDLLAQVEHGPGSQSVLVSPDPDVLAAIEPLLPAESGVVVVEADTLETALAFVNAYAPEHLQLMVADPERGARGRPSRRGDLRRPAQRDRLRRLHRRLEPHPADRRPQPVLVGPLARGLPAHAGGGRDLGRGLGGPGGSAGRAGPCRGVRRPRPLRRGARVGLSGHGAGYAGPTDPASAVGALWAAHCTSTCAVAGSTGRPAGRPRRQP